MALRLSAIRTSHGTFVRLWCTPAGTVATGRCADVPSKASSTSCAASASASPSRSSAAVTCRDSSAARRSSNSPATSTSLPDNRISNCDGSPSTTTDPSSATRKPSRRAALARAVTSRCAAVSWSAPSRAATAAMISARATASPRAQNARARDLASSAADPAHASGTAAAAVRTWACNTRAVWSHPSASRRSSSGRHASACDSEGRVTTRAGRGRCAVRPARTRRRWTSRPLPTRASRR